MAATTHVPPATSLREAYLAFDPKPLESGSPYFVDLTQARDFPAAEKLKSMIELCQPGHAAIAFAGHGGSGKSTELLGLRHAMRDSCFGIYLDVGEDLDPFDLDYTDLFLLVARRVLEELRAADVNISDKLLTAVENWFRDVTQVTERSVELSAGVATEASAGVELPFIARLLQSLQRTSKRAPPARFRLAVNSISPSVGSLRTSICF